MNNAPSFIWGLLRADHHKSRPKIVCDRERESHQIKFFMGVVVFPFRLVNVTENVTKSVTKKKKSCILHRIEYIFHSQLKYIFIIRLYHLYLLYVILYTICGKLIFYYFVWGGGGACLKA